VLTAMFHHLMQAAQETAEDTSKPSPIAPIPKELLWGMGSFFVFLIAMRLFIFPKLKKGMDARYGKITDDLKAADTLTAEAQSEVDQYREAQARIRAEAADRIHAARQTLDAERTDRLAEVNTSIAAKRADAATQAEQAKAAARASIESAVASVATRASELALGQRPDQSAVQAAVAEAMGAGVGR
jgi:F-type H+-transporting ATPase subunit b